jgi:hypothetical protein
MRYLLIILAVLSLVTLSYAADGKKKYFSDDKIRHVKDFEPVHDVPLRSPCKISKMVLSHTGARLMVICPNNDGTVTGLIEQRITVYNTVDGTKDWIAVLRTPRSFVATAKFSSDGYLCVLVAYHSRKINVLAEQGEIIVFDRRGKIVSKCKTRFKTGKFSHDGKYLYVFAYEKKKIKNLVYVNVKTGEAEKTLKMPFSCQYTKAFSNDMKLLCVVASAGYNSNRQKFMFYNLETDKKIKSILIPKTLGVSSVAFSKDNKSLIVLYSIYKSGKRFMTKIAVYNIKGNVYNRKIKKYMRRYENENTLTYYTSGEITVCTTGKAWIRILVYFPTGSISTMSVINIEKGAKGLMFDPIYYTKIEASHIKIHDKTLYRAIKGAIKKYILVKVCK